MNRSLVARTLARSGAALSAVGFAFSSFAFAGDTNARVATMIPPITVLAIAAAVATTRGSRWAWLFLLLEAALMLLALASVGMFFIPGLVLGMIGAVVVAGDGTRPVRRRLSA